MLIWCNTTAVFLRAVQNGDTAVRILLPAAYWHTSNAKPLSHLLVLLAQTLPSPNPFLIRNYMLCQSDDSCLNPLYLLLSFHRKPLHCRTAAGIRHEGRNKSYSDNNLPHPEGVLLGNFWSAVELLYGISKYTNLRTTPCWGWEFSDNSKTDVQLQLAVLKRLFVPFPQWSPQNFGCVLGSAVLMSPE